MARGARALDEPVSESMTEAVVTTTDSATIQWVMTEMTAGRFRHLPVIENSRLAGIVSIGDVVKFRLAEFQHEAEALKEYITVG